MTETTQIHPNKVRAYMATDYRLGHTDQDIVLAIGKHSERLATLFAGNSVNCGAFLTAYNPQGTIQSDAANARGHAELASKLQKLGLQAIEGSGSEDGTEWPAEKSYFALGLALEQKAKGFQVQTRKPGKKALLKQAAPTLSRPNAPNSVFALGNWLPTRA